MTQFLNDTFTDADNTLITAHVGETGATWTAISSALTNPRIKSNRASMGSGGSAFLTASGTPGSADYAITARFFAETATNTSICNINARVLDTSNYYTARYNFFNGNWEIYTTVAAASTLLGSYTQLITQGNTYTIIFTLIGTALTLNIDGTDRISVINSDLATAGVVGFECFSSAGNDDGFQIDTMSASDFGVVASAALLGQACL